MGNVSATNQPVQCNGNKKTDDAVKDAFNAALTEGKDKTLGYVGGYTVPKNGKRGYGQLKLVYHHKDKSIHLEGEKGKGYDKKLSLNPLEAIGQARKIFKLDASIIDKLIPLAEPCLKPKLVPVSKVGKQIEIKAAPEFVKMTPSEGGKPYYVAFYKTSDKWAVGLDNGRAVAIGAKLTDSNWNRDQMAAKLLDASDNSWTNVPKGFFGRNVKRYSEEEVKEVLSAAASSKTPPAKASSAKSATSYAYAPSAQVKPLGELLFYKDDKGAVRAIKVFAYGGDSLAIPTSDGRYVVLKTSRSVEGAGEYAAAETLAIFKKNDIKLSTYIDPAKK